MLLAGVYYENLDARLRGHDRLILVGHLSQHLTVGGRKTRLLDEMDVISVVSDGSFTAE